MHDTVINLRTETQPGDAAVRGDQRLRVVEMPKKWAERPEARGKFLFIGEEKYWVRGVSYGAFRPDSQGREYADQEKLDRDFALMSSLGINTVRIPHTVPPVSLLDTAQRHGLRVIIGLSAEQYVGYLIDKGKKTVSDIESEIREKVRTCAAHPALLCYALGNEIQASLVRWLGPKRVQRFLRGLYEAVKDEDPDGLVTYVNYPTTEYLDLSFLDLLAFNVYLETQDRLQAYLSRLQNIAGERPLLMTEIGLDSLRNGEAAQAKSLKWQIRSAFHGGCVGTVIFSWTDEWFRAGAEVEDWAFGITDKDRNPKAAASVVKQAYGEVPFPRTIDWPGISVVICSLNGANTIRRTLEACTKLNYPDYEVIVISDGSTDATPNIAREYDVRVICTKNQGLSAARNVGLGEATGEIVAYIDDDAYPDPDWLSFLAQSFLNSDRVGVGGPNLLPPDDGDMATCVYGAPGGPVHVLLDDDTAEHIPGCNMAFRKEALEAIGGFDPRFRAAGDDVDICWRLQDEGWRIGYSPSALVWHHRRATIGSYWKQQRGYGKAEALLEEKWPERYNALGHVTWSGQIYGAGLRWPLGVVQRIYHGVWGAAPFQSVYPPNLSIISSFLLMPEWYLLVIFLAASIGFGLDWPLLLWAGPLLVFALALPAAQALSSASRASFMGEAGGGARKLRLWITTAFLHLLQPAARLIGRLVHAKASRRLAPFPILVPPYRHDVAVWTETWRPPETYVYAIERALRQSGAKIVHGSAFDRWDLATSKGPLGGARLAVAVEDHGAGTQYVRMGFWPDWPTPVLVLLPVMAGLAVAACFAGAWSAAWYLAALALVLLVLMLQRCVVAMGDLAWSVQAAGDGLRAADGLRASDGEAQSCRKAGNDRDLCGKIP